MAKIDATAIILTKNEVSNIRDCIASIQDCMQRILVVDSGSADRTVEIAKEMGAQVLEHPFETYAVQFNWALDHGDIQTKWALRLDADERLTPALCEELAALTAQHDQDDVNGVIMEAWLYFMGKRLEHGPHRKRKLMLFKTGIGRIENRKMDEHTVLSCGTAVCAKERFIHYDFKNLDHWINKMNWYATREVQDYYDFISGKDAQIHAADAVISNIRKKKFGFYYKMPMFLRCWMLFVYNYIFRLGFLNGKEGFVYSFMYHLWYRSLVDAKILEQEKQKRALTKKKDRE